jgi:hypothetical protein
VDRGPFPERVRRYLARPIRGRINLGTAEVLIDFFSAALSSARILPQIGDTEVEEYFWDEPGIDPSGVPAPSGACRGGRPAIRTAAGGLSCLPSWCLSSPSCMS